MKIDNNGNFTPTSRDELASNYLTIFRNYLSNLSFTQASLELGIVRAVADTVYSIVQPIIISIYNQSQPTKATGNFLEAIFYPRERKSSSNAVGFFTISTNSNYLNNVRTLVIPAGTIINYNDVKSTRTASYIVNNATTITLSPVNVKTVISVTASSNADSIGVLGNLPRGIESIGTTGVTEYDLSFSVNGITYPNNTISGVGIILTSGDITGGTNIESDTEYRNRIFSAIKYGSAENSEFGLLGALFNNPNIIFAKIKTNATNEINPIYNIPNNSYEVLVRDVSDGNDSQLNSNIANTIAKYINSWYSPKTIDLNLIQKILNINVTQKVGSVTYNNTYYFTVAKKMKAILNLGLKMNGVSITKSIKPTTVQTNISINSYPYNNTLIYKYNYSIIFSLDLPNEVRDNINIGDDVSNYIDNVFFEAGYGIKIGNVKYATVISKNDSNDSYFNIKVRFQILSSGSFNSLTNPISNTIWGGKIYKRQRLVNYNTGLGLLRYSNVGTINGLIMNIQYQDTNGIYYTNQKITLTISYNQDDKLLYDVKPYDYLCNTKDLNPVFKFYISNITEQASTGSFSYRGRVSGSNNKILADGSFIVGANPTVSLGTYISDQPVSNISNNSYLRNIYKITNIQAPTTGTYYTLTLDSNLDINDFSSTNTSIYFSSLFILQTPVQITGVQVNISSISNDTLVTVQGIANFNVGMVVSFTNSITANSYRIINLYTDGTNNYIILDRNVTDSLTTNNPLYFGFNKLIINLDYQNSLYNQLKKDMIISNSINGVEYKINSLLNSVITLENGIINNDWKVKQPILIVYNIKTNPFLVKTNSANIITAESTVIESTLSSPLINIKLGIGVFGDILYRLNKTQSEKLVNIQDIPIDYSTQDTIKERIVKLIGGSFTSNSNIITKYNGNLSEKIAPTLSSIDIVNIVYEEGDPPNHVDEVSNFVSVFQSTDSNNDIVNYKDDSISYNKLGSSIGNVYMSNFYSNVDYISDYVLLIGVGLTASNTSYFNIKGKVNVGDFIYDNVNKKDYNVNQLLYLNNFIKTPFIVSNISFENNQTILTITNSLSLLNPFLTGAIIGNSKCLIDENFSFSVSSKTDTTITINDDVRTKIFKNDSLYFKSIISQATIGGNSIQVANINNLNGIFKNGDIVLPNIPNTNYFNLNNVSKFRVISVVNGSTTTSNASLSVNRNIQISDNLITNTGLLNVSIDSEVGQECSLVQTTQIVSINNSNIPFLNIYNYKFNEKSVIDFDASYFYATYLESNSVSNEILLNATNDIIVNEIEGTY